MTSTSLGWVILDRQGPDAFTLDHDAFDVQSTADGTNPDPSQHTAAARGAQAIATASGHKVGAVQVTWSDDMAGAAADLLKSLADLGFDNIVTIPLNQAVHTWGIEVGRANEHDKTALCILKPGTATVMVVATEVGSVRTAVTYTRDHATDLIDWLMSVFNRDGWLPESLHLVGARDDLDVVAGPIGDALPIPVFDSVDTQLALARGAALATVTVRPPQEAETQASDPPSRPDRSWLVSNAKKVTITAAAIAIVGAALSLTAGSALSGKTLSTQAANPPAEGASVTSASAHTVPTRISAPPSPIQPLAAEPPSVPPAPPEVPQLPAEPLFSAAVPEPTSVPVRQQTISAPPPAAPLVVPPPAAPRVVAPAPVAPPPAAPLAAPPAPIAAPPPPPQPEEPPPPPDDPVQVLLSPLFSALP